jgi:putative membrane protein
MVRFLLRAAVAACALWSATVWVPGVTIDNSSTLILAGVLLGVVNAVVKPVAVVLTFPLTIVTLGLFLLVINAGMVGLVAWMLPGMHVAGFWPAFWSALIVSLANMISSRLIGPRGRIEIVVRR